MSCLNSHPESGPISPQDVSSSEAHLAALEGRPWREGAAGGTPQLLCIGQPLVDISAHMGSAFVVEHGLTLGGWQMAGPEHGKVYDALERRNSVKFTIGGSAFNSVKVAQKVARMSPGFTGGIGCVGDDTVGSKLIEKLEEADVKPLFVTRAGETTGKCGILIDPDNAARTMLTSLGAGRTFNLEDIQVYENEIRNCQLLLTVGYMFNNPGGLEVLHRLTDTLKKAGGGLVFSLGAAPLVRNLRDELRDFLPRADIVFCNDEEAMAYFETFLPAEEQAGLRDAGEGEVLSAAARAIATLPRETRDLVDAFPERVVVVTRGKDPAVLAIGNEVTLHSLPAVPRDKVIDTNGAGDTFCGGYLAAILQGAPHEDALRLGHACASRMIQVIGCELDCLDTISLASVASSAGTEKEL